MNRLEDDMKSESRVRLSQLLMIVACSSVLAAPAGCRPAAVEKPAKLAPMPTEPGTYQDRPNLNR
jgi:hypothetical protein